jgi:hypothetical protein
MTFLALLISTGDRRLTMAARFTAASGMASKP